MDKTAKFPNTAFDNEKYLAEQTTAITDRIGRFDNKLYLEFGGKLLFDYHASRVLPGFDPNVKMRLLQNLGDKVDIILCIYAGDIERRKVRADFGITYDSDTFKLIDDIRTWGLDIQAVVITRFTGQPAAVTFMRKLERRGVRVYTHKPIEGYPTDVDKTVSDDGYGGNPFIETTQPLVVVNAPGPNSGKMATCLSQVYHEHKRGVNAGYAKFETFPIWNLPLRHPINVAYEAATADLRDVNMIDPFHLEAHGKTTVNYNRDIEAFPLLRRILEKITGSRAMYQSPTDMGVNRAGFAIVDDKVAAEAAKQELIRRYFHYACEHAMGLAEKETVQRAKLLMDEFDLEPETRPVVTAACKAREAAEKKTDKGNRGVFCGAAIALPDGKTATGQNSPLMHAASSLVLNSIKSMAGIPRHLELISPIIMESISDLRKDILRRDSVSLNLSETLIALGISSTTNPTARLAMDQLTRLRGCEMHITHLPTPGDEKALRRLGVNLTSDPRFATQKLFAS
ncbi:MAG: DUF1846 domain-containing protein [Proteobacteria bacterium]|nr:DUF1846 domain-containing protein [Pseudomonadota bacterium]